LTLEQILELVYCSLDI